MDSPINLGGRPALYDSEDELKTQIEAYFETEGIRSTITGLAYFLGFESRQSIYDYADNGKFSYIIKRAKLFVESCYESKLSGNNPTGPIFFLKNMGWKEKSEVDIGNRDDQPFKISLKI